MNKETFHIPNISCGHCTSAIENEVKEIPGVTAAAGDIEAKTVAVQWEGPATKEAILSKLTEIHYPAAH